MRDMPPLVVEHLLTKAASPWQFELFCARHFSAVEHVHYVITSRNYDAGRDARTEFPNRFAGSSYIVASLQQEGIESKAREDLKKLLKRDKKPGKVRFCFTAEVTEVLRDKIIATARKLCPHSFYEVSGRVQLLESIDRFPDVFEKEFENEIDQFRRFVRRDVSHTDDLIGLRVIFGTQLSGTSEELRMHILRALVMRSIPAIGEVTLPQICTSVSNLLSLDPPVHDSYLLVALESLKRDELVAIEPGRTIRRRRKAFEVMDQQNLRAALNVIDGFAALREGLERFLNAPPAANVMRNVWQIVRNGVVRLFLRHGLDVARSLHRLSAELPPELGESISDDLVRRLGTIANEIADLEATHDDEIYRRISACFSSVMLAQGSAARRWFSELALVYITACSLSLHPDAVKQIERRVQSWRVVPDTHFVLSLLGCSEPDHEATRHLTTAWTKLGGAFIAAPPVVSEAYRHACKALDSFHRWVQNYRRHERNAARRGSGVMLPDRNVFLRSAQRELGEALTIAAVEPFLNQFGTRQDGDARRIEAILEDVYHFIFLERRDTSGALKKAFYDDLMVMRQGHHELDDYNTKDRCETDADLLVYLSELRRAPEARRKVTVVLSNSGHMKRVCAQYPAAFSAGSPIVNVARVAFALSLQPGTAMTLRSLESMFFGGDFAGLVSMQRSRAEAVLDEYTRQDGRGLFPTALRDQVDNRIFDDG